MQQESAKAYQAMQEAKEQEKRRAEKEAREAELKKK